VVIRIVSNVFYKLAAKMLGEIIIMTKKFLMTLIVILFTLLAVSCSDSDGNSKTKVDDDVIASDDSESKDEDSLIIVDSDSKGSDETVEETEDEDSAQTSECTGVSFGSLELDGAYIGTINEKFGTSEDDDLITLEFYSETGEAVQSLSTGKIDLGSEINSNYKTCTHCLRVVDVEGQEIATTFFQESGELEITEVKEGTLESKGVVTAKLVEVTVDQEYNSTPVEGGGCVEITAAAWDTICVPDCEGKICGSDGCGGSCGTACEEGKRCSADQKACEDYSCTGISIDAKFALNADYETIMEVAPAENIGGDGADIITVDFYNAEGPVTVPAVGTYDLASGGNNSYATCSECVLVYQDFESEDGKVFFQQSGTLEVVSVVEGEMISTGSLLNVRVEEVIVDGDNFESTPVAGGDCFEIATASWEITGDPETSDEDTLMVLD